MPQLEEDLPHLIFEQDSASPHFHQNIPDHLNATLPGRWNDRAGHHDLPIVVWPPRSPDLTPCDFFLWGYVKDIVYVPPLPQQLNGLKNAYLMQWS